MALLSDRAKAEILVDADWYGGGGGGVDYVRHPDDPRRVLETHFLGQVSVRNLDMSPHGSYASALVGEVRENGGVVGVLVRQSVQRLDGRGELTGVREETQLPYRAVLDNDYLQKLTAPEVTIPGETKNRPDSVPPALVQVAAHLARAVQLDPGAVDYVFAGLR